MTNLSQKVHLKGFSPECVRLWIVKAPVIANDFPHPGKSQMYGSVWEIVKGASRIVLVTHCLAYADACAAEV